MKTHNDLPGWFDFHDIYKMAVDTCPKDGEHTFIEIGTCFGKSAVYMAEEIEKSRKKLIKIGNSDTFEEEKFIEQLHKFIILIV